jgi:hypothetical protein
MNRQSGCHRAEVSRSNVNKFNLKSANWRASQLKSKLAHALRAMAPTLLALTFAGVAHAKGTMDFSGAQTLMGKRSKRA